MARKSAFGFIWPLGAKKCDKIRWFLGYEKTWIFAFEIYWPLVTGYYIRNICTAKHYVLVVLLGLFVLVDCKLEILNGMQRINLHPRPGHMYCTLTSRVFYCRTAPGSKRHSDCRWGNKLSKWSEGYVQESFFEIDLLWTGPWGQYLRWLKA